MNWKDPEIFISESERVETSILEKSPGCLNCISFLPGPGITTKENQQTVSPPFWVVCLTFHSIGELIQLSSLSLTCALASWLLHSTPAFEPWPGTLCCVLGHDTLLSPCLSPSLHMGWAPYQRLFCHYRLIIDWTIPSVSTDIDLSTAFFHRLDTPGYVRVSPFFSYSVLVEKLQYMCIRNGGRLSCILSLSTHEHRRWTLLSRHLLVRRLLLFQQNNC